MTIVLLKWNGQMLMKWLSPSSSGDVVHVFMSSFSETAEAENTASSTRFSMYVCSKWNRTSVSFINRDAEYAGFIFK